MADYNPVKSNGDVDADGAARFGFLSGLAANKTYQDQTKNLQASVNANKNTLQKNYNETLGALASDYNNSVNSVNQAAAQSLKEAYINNMMSQKNLKQKLASQGLTGGATESTVARLLNAYGNNRNSINANKNSYLANLANTYNQNRASAAQSYNTALSNLQNQATQQQNQYHNQLYDRLNQSVQDYWRSAAYNPEFVDSLTNLYVNATNMPIPQLPQVSAQQLYQYAPNMFAGW